jgi:hypothetical protein
MKLMIMIGITVVGTLGGWLGSLMDHGNMFGIWGLALGTIGSFAGIYVGYKAGQYLGV